MAEVADKFGGVTVEAIVRRAKAIFHNKKFIKGVETTPKEGRSWGEYIRNFFSKASRAERQDAIYDVNHVGAVCAIGAIKVAAVELGVSPTVLWEPDGPVAEAIRFVTETGKSMIESGEIVVTEGYEGDTFEVPAEDIYDEEGIVEINDAAGTKKGTIKAIFARAVERFA